MPPPRPVKAKALPAPSRPVAASAPAPGRPEVLLLRGGGQALHLPPALRLARPGHGHRLPEAVQRKMEQLFGTGFDDVRVHVAWEANALGTLAFTSGSDVYFAPGQLQPATVQGERLLAHELTHVVQQRAGRVHNPFGQGVAVVQDPWLELEAERMSARALSMPAAPAGGRPRALQRKAWPAASPLPRRHAVVQRMARDDEELWEVPTTGAYLTAAEKNELEGLVERYDVYIDDVGDFGGDNLTPEQAQRAAQIGEALGQLNLFVRRVFGGAFDNPRGAARHMFNYLYAGAEHIGRRSARDLAGKSLMYLLNLANARNRCHNDVAAAMRACVASLVKLA